MGFVERHFMPWTGTHLGLGLQMEMPLWNSDDGLAGEHLMLVPYMSWSQSARSFSFGGNLGIGYAVTGEHHHSVGEEGGSPVYVNPHADRELLYRAWVGVNLWNRLEKPELFLDGQRVLLDHTEDETGFLSAGMSLRLALGRISVAPGFEVPVFSSRRKDWRFGIQGAVPM